MAFVVGIMCGSAMGFLLGIIVSTRSRPEWHSGDRGGLG